MWVVWLVCVPDNLRNREIRVARRASQPDNSQYAGLAVARLDGVPHNPAKAESRVIRLSGYPVIRLSGGLALPGQIPQILRDWEERELGATQHEFPSDS